MTVRDAEDDTDIDRLGALPMVRGLASINRLLAPPDFSSEQDLREIAAELQSDMLLLYTFETTFEDDRAIPLAGTITLGLFPARIAKCRSSAQAILVDTRTGYVYAVTESAAEESRRTNIWNSDRALERARLMASSTSSATRGAKSSRRTARPPPGADPERFHASEIGPRRPCASFVPSKSAGLRCMHQVVQFISRHRSRSQHRLRCHVNGTTSWRF